MIHDTTTSSVRSFPVCVRVCVRTYWCCNFLLLVRLPTAMGIQPRINYTRIKDLSCLKGYLDKETILYNFSSRKILNIFSNNNTKNTYIGNVDLIRTHSHNTMENAKTLNMARRLAYNQGAYN